MCEGQNAARPGEDLKKRPHVEPGRREKRARKRTRRFERRRVVPAQSRSRDDTANQRKTIGMYPGGGQSEHRVAGLETGTRQKRPPLGGPDCETRKIKVTRRVETRHFGRFTADQRAAGLGAPIGYSFDDDRRDVLVERPGSEVIQEKERLSALDDDIVYAHRNKIDSNRIVYAAFDRDLDLGADAIVGCDENRVGKTSGPEIEEAPESAQFGVGAGATGRPGQRLDTLDETVTAI